MANRRGGGGSVASTALEEADLGRFGWIGGVDGRRSG